MLAGAARLRGDPERASSALETIEELARDTVGELDRLLAPLRERRRRDSARPRVPADTRRAPRVVRPASRSGGRPAAAAGGHVDQAAYRILQEALTNAARHGSGTAHVDLGSATPCGADSHQPCRRRSRAAGGGHGLIGMRERAALTGGDARDRRGRGCFRVHAACRTR